ncbi:adenylyl-sulfate kinase [Sinomicrobium kalidii]|uniref:adenylyl-sulfate kinase n=1 Tax=Sinomicrobium kalidii TaxID=2900738 RepID=UPI001E4729C0|nr:adenylyl-sulfate kinase [Sinomicrobium kalidii]UGU14360.1 adenylyl-sulfate kinase [Sinomicrobium kalidii]
MEKNVVKQYYKVSKRERNLSNGHNSFLLWFTGLSGSGKSTIANAVEQRLHDEGVKTYVLDGDNIRRGINSDLSFSPEDRSENIRRIAEIANLMVDAGLVVLAAFVSPYKKDREFIANTVKPSNFVEIYVSTSLEECERRDVKGLYKKAREGKIDNMTGVSAPYEAPENPDIEIHTEKESVPEAVEKVMNAIKTKLES